MKNSDSSDVYSVILEKINTLPSLPQIIHKIENTLSDPNTSVNDIVEVLKLDPVIVGKVLRLANSAYIGMPRTVSSLKNAVIILGQKRIHSLVLTSSILSLFHPFPVVKFDMKSFWKHSVTVAMISESIGKHLKRYEIIDPEEIFCSGILHDIGKLILSIYKPGIIMSVNEKASETNSPFFENEDPSMSHMKIGSLVAKHWHFPLNLIQSILYHHTPHNMKKLRKEVIIIHISDIIAHTIGFHSCTGEVIPELNESTLDVVGLNPEFLRVIAQKTLEKEKQLNSLFVFIS